MADTALERVREIALALPDVAERLSHGAPTFRVGSKGPICYFHSAEFSSDGRVSLWCPAAPGVQDELVASEPARFFAPTPSESGVFQHWIGVYLDTEGDLAADWGEVAAIIEDAFRLKASRKQVARLDEV